MRTDSLQHSSESRWRFEVRSNEDLFQDIVLMPNCFYAYAISPASGHIIMLEGFSLLVRCFESPLYFKFCTLLSLYSVDPSALVIFRAVRGRILSSLLISLQRPKPPDLLCAANNGSPSRIDSL